jgi:hypothetical protein
MRVRAGVLAAALTLAACGGEPQQEAAAPEPAPASTPVVAPSDTASGPEIGPTIPARFHGVWDNESGTCDPASEQRLRIASNGIGFIESHGTVTRLTVGTDGKVTLDLAMEGEAQAWDATFTLESTGSGAGERLLLLEPPGPNSEIMLRPIRFKRCPS